MGNNKIRETKYGWVDLSNIPIKNEKLNWKESIGSTISFKYKDVVAYMIIKAVENRDLVYVDVPGYIYDHRMYIRYIKYGKFERCVRTHRTVFRYNIGDIVNDIKIIGRYMKDYKQYYICQCIFDGHEWHMRLDHLSGGHGCPICKNSIGEKQVKNYLIEHHIKFIPQHSFNDCRHIKLLYFDFYLPDFNVCIEYDGKQHFEPIDFFGGIEGFKETQKRDEIKNLYCRNNSITMLRIKYDQNIKNILDDFFYYKNIV